MAFTPSTTIYLCSVPIDSTQDNQLSFSSAAAQAAYFSSTSRHVFAAETYQRKDSTADVAAHIDTLWDSNYVMYQNSNFTNKWFYAFITKMEFLSNGSTRLWLETDVYQTWLFDTELKESFVVREMIGTDTLGASLTDEGLDTGEYLKHTITTLSEMDALAVVVAVTETWNGTVWTPVVGGMYSGVYSGLMYYAFFGANLASQVNAFLGDYNDAANGKISAVAAIFMLPRVALAAGMTSGTAVDPDTLLGTSNTKAVTYSITQVGSYTPRNKKVLQYPYHFLHVTNLAGQSMDLRFELTYDKSGTFNFSYRTNIAPGAKTLIMPLSGYKRTSSAIDSNSEETITMQNYPMCGWVSDTWNNWIAQNALGAAAGFAGSITSIAGGVAVGNPMAVAGGLVGIMNELGQIAKHSIEPDQARGNINGSTVQIAWGMQHFQFCEMIVTPEFAARLDDFFDMFGYKTNLVKVPNVSGRTYWNYVKTIDVNILGDIPADDMVKLKGIYNKGVTIWHIPANVGNYALNNH